MKCIRCEEVLVNGDSHWEQGLCNHCYYEKTIEVKDQQIAELKKQLEEKDDKIQELLDYTITLENGWNYQEYLNLQAQLHSQPKEIVEKIIYHYDLNQIRDQFKNGFYGDARCVAIDGLGLIIYLEEMLKEYQK